MQQDSNSNSNTFLDEDAKKPPNGLHTPLTSSTGRGAGETGACAPDGIKSNTRLPAALQQRCGSWQPS